VAGKVAVTDEGGKSGLGDGSASTRLAEYERYCREHGLAIQDLMD
jgi:2,4'-dihydroxyacetophenone dioxygenase